MKLEDEAWRLNIEARFLKDARFKILVNLLGGDQEKALGKCVCAWFLAQRFWAKGEKPMPREIFYTAGYDLLLVVHLAEEKDGGIYLKGTREQFEWIMRAHKGGKASAEKRREKGFGERCKGGKFTSKREMSTERTSVPDRTGSVSDRTRSVTGETVSQTWLINEDEHRTPFGSSPNAFGARPNAFGEHRTTTEPLYIPLPLRGAAPAPVVGQADAGPGGGSGLFNDLAQEGETKALKAAKKKTGQGDGRNRNGARASASGPGIETAFKAACRETWNAYAAAHVARYDCSPPDSAMQRSLIQTMVKKLGHEESPHVIAFYLTVNKAFYIEKRHELRYAVNDALPLRTDWLMGRTVTQREARAAELAGENLRAVSQFLESDKKKGGNPFE